MQELPILLIPEKTDIEFDAVFQAWVDRGATILRMGKYWVKDDRLVNEKIAVYGNPAFAFVLAQLYGATLISPDDTLIARLSPEWTKRRIRTGQKKELSVVDFPVFVKSVIPKMFVAGVFSTIESFEEATAGLPEEEEVLVSSVVENICAEARSFVLAGEIKDLAFYEGSADLQEGRAFLEDFIAIHRRELPETVVIDIAYAPATGWFILEFNACWGAGLNNCKADKVIDCIVAATVDH